MYQKFEILIVLLVFERIINYILLVKMGIKCTKFCFALFAISAIIFSILEHLVSRIDIKSYELLESPTHYNRIFTYDSLYVKEIEKHVCDLMHDGVCYKTKPVIISHLYVNGTYELNNETKSCDFFFGIPGRGFEKFRKGNKRVITVNKDTLNCNEGHPVLYPVDIAYTSVLIVTIALLLASTYVFMSENNVSF